MTKNSSTGIYAKLMEQQKQRLEQAHKRQGEFLTLGDQQSKLLQDRLLLYIEMLDHQSIGDSLLVDSSIISPYYAPSSTPLARLKQLHPRDLQLETHHRGFYLMLRNLKHLVKIAGVIISLMEDEFNNMVMTSHHSDDIERFSIGGFYVIKEPYFTIMSDGNYSVRVDHVTDMVRIPDEDGRVLRNPRWNATGASLTPHILKEEGNKAMGNGRIHDAITM
jgi:hypothetical protein